MGAKRKPYGRPKNWVRLECTICDRDDHDGITEAKLEECLKTWEDIYEQQSWEDATTVWTEEQMKQHGDRSNLIWCTHQGMCPECIAAGDEYHEQIAARNARQATLF